MTSEIELDGRRYRIALRRDGTLWVANLDGRDVAVGVVEIGGRWSMLVGETSYEIAFEPGSGGELVVHVNGTAIPLTILDRQRRRRRGAQGAGADRQPRTIVSPMPGRIVKVLVKPGEAVQARQGLIVVEAMKMENELRAPRDGTVEDVRVAEGSSVEANAVLVVLR